MEWHCKRCGFEMVEIEVDSLVKIKKELNPIFLGLPHNWSVSESDLKICPKCNAYPLGLGENLYYSIRTKSGEMITIHDLDYIKAHNHIGPRQELMESEICGCFHCCEIFGPDKITEWFGEDEQGIEQYPMCPECGIDSVIGSASGYPIEYSFLKKMKDFWFSESTFIETMCE